MSLEIELAKNTAAVAAMTEALTTLRIVLETPAAPVASIPVFAEVFTAPAMFLVPEITEAVEDSTDFSTATISYAEVAAKKIMAKPRPVIESVERDYNSQNIVTKEVVEAPKPTMPTDVGTVTISYAEVAAAIVSTFKADRNKTVAALAQFGAKKGPELKPEDYAAFLSVLTA